MSIRRRRLIPLAIPVSLSVAALAFVSLIGACSTEVLTPQNAGTIAVSPREATIEGIGTALALNAAANDAAGGAVSDPNISWVSLHPSVASVSADGLVITTGLGTAMITVTFGTAADTAILHVIAAAEPTGLATVTVTPSLATIEGIGERISLTATARTATGETVQNPALSWSTQQPSVASVSSGVVTSLSEGTAKITVTFQDGADTATIQVIAASVPPSSSTLTVSPTEASLQGIGNTLSLLAIGRTQSGGTISSSNFTWTSLDPAIATVSSGGLVTSTGTGTTKITVTYQDLADTATIHVTSGSPPLPPPTGEQWNRVLANIVIQGDVVVPDGERWLIGPAVQIAGNLRTTGGTIAMRPGSALKFVGANPEEYLGGGQTFAPEFARDIGLWIGPLGVLDIRGTPKTGWNRTGVDPTWRPEDEYWVAPTNVGDYEPRRWAPGEPIPQVDPRVPPSEVINVTRDITIEGPAHIHIHSQRAQRIEYVQLRRLGLSRSGGPVLGRYALHLHFSGEGSRGTIIRGVAAVDSKGTVFVPHSSHGITMTDNVSVNSFGTGLWWDKGDRTNDLLVDRLAVSGVNMPREVSGEASRVEAAVLGSGSNMEVRNSAVSGAWGNKLSVGWHWSTDGVHKNPAKWTFEQGNVTHNNSGPGIRFWFNDQGAHHVANTVTYRNGEGGIQNGAYVNAVRYSDVLLVDDHIFHNSSSTGNNETNLPGGYERCRVFAREGPAFTAGHRNVSGPRYLEVVDCSFTPGPGAPKVFVTNGDNPWLANFRRSGVLPEDFAFDEPIASSMNGSRIVIEHEDGRKWEIVIEGGQKIIRPL
jgi:uncharacterized protein YjdB